MAKKLNKKEAAVVLAKAESEIERVRTQTLDEDLATCDRLFGRRHISFEASKTLEGVKEAAIQQIRDAAQRQIEGIEW
jgi:hypothetical protein